MSRIACLMLSLVGICLVVPTVANAGPTDKSANQIARISDASRAEDNGSAAGSTEVVSESEQSNRQAASRARLKSTESNVATEQPRKRVLQSQSGGSGMSNYVEFEKN